MARRYEGRIPEGDRGVAKVLRQHPTAVRVAAGEGRVSIDGAEQGCSSIARRQSFLSAPAGSIFDARRAGTRADTRAAARSMAPTPANVIGSRGLTS